MNVMIKFSIISCHFGNKHMTNFTYRYSLIFFLLMIFVKRLNVMTTRKKRKHTHMCGTNENLYNKFIFSFHSIKYVCVLLWICGTHKINCVTHINTKFKIYRGCLRRIVPTIHVTIIEKECGCADFMTERYEFSVFSFKNLFVMRKTLL